MRSLLSVSQRQHIAHGNTLSTTTVTTVHVPPLSVLDASK